MLGGLDACKTCATNWASGTAPTSSVRSFMTIFGTPITLYFCARCGNSPTSTTSDLTMSLSIANLCDNPAATGQYGHVKVTNTCMCTGLSNPFSFALMSSLTVVAAFGTLVLV